MKNADNFYLNRAAVLVNDGDIIPCSVALASEFGVNSALFLQQLHFRIRGTRKSKGLHEGRYWYYCTLEDWQVDDFPFWSVMTLRRIIDKLKEDGILIVGNFNKMRRDRTHWYTIDYNRMWEIENGRAKNIHTRVPSVQSEQLPSVRSEQMTSVQSEHTITIRKNTTDLQKTRPTPSAPTGTTAAALAVVVKKTTDTQLRETLLKRFARKAPSVPDLETWWRNVLTMYDYKQNLTFGPQEHGNMRTMRREIEGTGIKVHDFLEYCVANWKLLRHKITWETGKSKLGDTPSFRSIFFSRHELLEVMQSRALGDQQESGKETTKTYTRVEDLPDMPSSRKKQLAEMIKKLGSVTI